MKMALKVPQDSGIVEGHLSTHPAYLHRSRRSKYEAGSKDDVTLRPELANCLLGCHLGLSICIHRLAGILLCPPCMAAIIHLVGGEVNDQGRLWRVCCW